MNKIPLLEESLFQEFKKLHIPLSKPIFFSGNITRKTSPHRALCLNIHNSAEEILYILKIPASNSIIGKENLLWEYNILLQLQEKKIVKNNLPKPILNFFIEENLVVIQDYIPHTLLHKLLEQNKSCFSSEIFEKPLNWLIKFNKHTKAKKAVNTAKFIQDFTSDILEKISPGKRDLIPRVEHFLDFFLKELTTFKDQTIPLVWLHGDFNPYNIGLKLNKQLVIFDWEDSQKEFAILFDFFNFVIGFSWNTFAPKHQNWRKKELNYNLKKIIKLAKQYLKIYEVEFNLNQEQINGLFILFLINNIGMELNIKRESPDYLVERWFDILEFLKKVKPKENYFLAYLSIEEELLDKLYEIA